MCDRSCFEILGMNSFMKKQQGNQPLDFSSGLVDLECFLAWSERIKLDMSKSNPLLYKVLESLAFSRNPIAGGDSFQAESAEASFLQGMSHQHSGADKEKEAKERQVRSEGRQLGCLLVQRTKGETQLKVTKWLVATNGWEAWKQLNLSFLSRLLNSLLHTSFEDIPASCLQQLFAWKERVAIYQELFGNSTNQQEQKHQKKKAWHSPSRKKQLQRDNGDQSFAEWLASNKSLMRSFEKQSQDKSLAMPDLDNSLAAPTWALLVDTGAATSVAPKSFAPHLELSPAPSTFQLATATGEAIKIFGLRHVHVQCQDLSFKVSFVIADVVTPILGLDTLLEHNLSLNFGHDDRTFLVNSAGKRTQLQQKGEHLYLVTCPFQHGLSTCSRGSLPEVIGFLPEDQELHDQQLALQSSSSTALVEDKSFLESLHVHEKSNFVCVLCEERLQFQGESFPTIACIPSSNPRNLQAQTSSFTTSILDLQSIDLRSFEKQKAQLQRRRSHMYSQQPVCVIFQTLLGMIQLCC